jgi:hypothetical protein
MRYIFIVLASLFFVFSCAQNAPDAAGNNDQTLSIINSGGQTLQERISVPEGYTRRQVDEISFAYFLRNLPVKPDGAKVFLFNGNLKNRQDVHCAVLDIDAGNRDLQQCADALMRLRAEYLYASQQYDKIAFDFVSDGKPRYFLNYSNGKTDSISFRKYLNYVFSYANTRSLRNQLTKVENSRGLKIGDAFIQAGNPFGHAVIIMDIAENSESGEQIYLLAQSYMPAQDIHVLRNPSNKDGNPWYSISSSDDFISTPEWTFYLKDMRTW